MSVALAEQPVSYREKTYGDGEVYAASMSSIRLLGEASLVGVGLEAATELAYDDFSTKVAEMLKTDVEFGEKLDITRVKHFSYSDGKVRAADGRAMVDIVRAGYEASLGSEDMRLQTTQAERDAGDLLVAEAVDELEIGRSMIVVSLDPKDQLRSSEASFWQDRGYREGIAYIQWYSRLSETEMAASALSFSHSDLLTVKQALIRRGVEVDDSVGCNQMIRQMWRFDGYAEEAGVQAEALRDELYESAGDRSQRLSVEGHMARHRGVVDSIFHTYYPLIGRALVTGRNQTELQEFAGQMLGQIQAGQFSPEIVRQVISVANSSSFTPDMARVLDSLLPYAVVEQLRHELKTAESRTVSRLPQESTATYSGPSVSELASMSHQMVLQMAASAISAGVKAGRSYGGCSSVKLNKEGVSELSDGLQQDIFGGNGMESEGDYPAGEDKYGPLTFKCTEGHTNRRRRGELLKECQTKGCKEGSVGC